MQEERVKKNETEGELSLPREKSFPCCCRKTTIFHAPTKLELLAMILDPKTEIFRLTARRAYSWIERVSLFSALHFLITFIPIVSLSCSFLLLLSLWHGFNHGLKTLCPPSYFLLAVINCTYLCYSFDNQVF